MEDIRQLRDAIDTIDAKLLALLNDRARSAQEIGRVKERNGANALAAASNREGIDDDTHQLRFDGASVYVLQRSWEGQLREAAEATRQADEDDWLGGGTSSSAPTSSSLALLAASATRRSRCRSRPGGGVRVFQHQLLALPAGNASHRLHRNTHAEAVPCVGTSAHEQSGTTEA